MKIDNDRIKHSLAVARKMVQIAKKIGLDEEKQKELFILGINHDIGYEFDLCNEHNKKGGEILKKSEFKYWQEVYYHGEVNPVYQSLYLDILNSADMQIDSKGNDVGYIERLKNIESRYGSDSQVYKRCELIINNLKKDRRFI